MKSFVISWYVLLVIPISFHGVKQSSEFERNSIETRNEFGDLEVERRYVKCHPNWEKKSALMWPETENLTVAGLQDICTQVLFDIYKSQATAESFPYTIPKRGNLKRRIIRRAKVRFSDGDKFLILLKCLYRNAEFYLAKGDDKCVFRLEKNRDNKCVVSPFYFHDGPHPIRYPTF